MAAVNTTPLLRILGTAGAEQLIRALGSERLTTGAHELKMNYHYPNGTTMFPVEDCVVKHASDN